MPLQGDQRALLQLLCERGQSYEDISGLLDISTDEVRARAAAALTELGGDDPDGEVALTDYLLGQADPIGRADAVRHLQGDPESLALAERIQDGLREIAPEAKQPKLPEGRGKRRRAALPDESAPPVATGDAGDRTGPHRQRRLIAGLAGLGIILIVVILAIAGVFSGGDDSTSSASSPSADGTTSTTAAGDDNITEVALKPVGGSGVAGTATFGLVSNQQLYVDVDVQGLDPSLDTGKSYLVWLMVGDNAGYPIDRLEADENGSFSGRLAVPTPIAVAVGNQARSVLVSSTSVSALQSEIKTAAKQKVPILPFTGTELASGDIPLVKAGQQKQGKKQQGG
jgi:hypothetical protein